MTTPRWFPFLGYTPADADDGSALDLDPVCHWDLFVFEWFGLGMVFWARRGEQRA